jgi:hypothetical protein
VPPNQAAANPEDVSTIVEAWQEGVGLSVKTNSERISAGESDDLRAFNAGESNDAQPLAKMRRSAPAIDRENGPLSLWKEHS